MSSPSRVTLLLSPAGPRQRQISYAVVAFLMAVLCVVIARLPESPAFPVDDAYITLHNAQALRAGHDDRFIGAPALLGATSSIHVILVTLFLFFLKPLWAHFTVSCLGAIAYALGLMRLAFVLGASVIEAPLVLVAGMIVAETPHQLLNGLETGWAMAALVWALAAACERPVRREWELPVLAGLLPFLRPEMIVLTALFLGLRVWELQEEHGLAGALRPAGRTIGFCAAAMAPWLLAYLATTGVPWPTTVAAKQHFFAEGCYPHAVKEEWIVTSMTRFVATIGTFAAVALLWWRNRVGKIFALFTLSLIFAYYRNFPGALGHYEQRYLYILLPGLIFAPLPLLQWKRPFGQIICAALLAICIFQSGETVGERWTFHRNAIAFTRVELGGVADWVEKNVRPGSRLLVHDAGYIGFASHMHLFDMVGLKTPSSAPFHEELTWQSCGQLRGEAIARIAALDRPEYLVVLTGWNKLYGITRALTDHGWRLDLKRTGVYEVYRAFPPLPVFTLPPGMVPAVSPSPAPH